MTLEDESLIQDFVAESRDHLDNIEPDLLSLEKDGENVDAELINRVFRAIHSIKGASGFFGFDNLKRLSHVMENLLMKVRDKEIVPNPDIVEPLLVGVDKLREMVDDIHVSHTVQCDDLIGLLEQVLANGGKLPENAKSLAQLQEEATDIPAPISESGIPNFDPDIKSLDDAIAHGHQIFAISVYVDQDIDAKHRLMTDFYSQIGSIGVVLSTAFYQEALPSLESCLETKIPLVFLIGSVLEMDLVAAAIDIPQDQIRILSREEILQRQEPSTSQPVQTIEPVVAAPAPEPVQIDAALPPEQPVASKVAAEKPPSPAPQAAPPAEPKKAALAPSGESESIRVKVDLLNKLMDLAGEMVLSRNQLLRAIGRDTNQSAGLAAIVQNVDLITSDLQEHIMQTRMQAVGSVFSKFPRLVRDLAKQLNKEIELVMTGEDVELDKSIIEGLSDPLTHLIRNCCDHALEEPAERQQAGKNATGTIQLRAFHEGGQINIAITDDGRGINVDKIAKKVLENGLMSDADMKKMSFQEKVNLIFLPGLSTAETVSEVSGRGVGMDVVRTNIEKIGGHITIDTIPGKGTTILLRLPLTLAIIPSLIVGVSGQRYAMPQINLVGLVLVKAADIAKRIEKVGTASVLRLRGKLLPLVHLSSVLGIDKLYFDSSQGKFMPDKRLELADVREIDLDRPEPENRRQSYQSDYNIMVLKVGTNQFGLVVDELFDTEEIVVKPLSSYLKNCKVFAGATIMGDGRVAMILDAGGILNQANLSFADLDEEERRRDIEKLRNISLNKTRQSVILFKNSATEVFAVPLDSVLRLEKIALDEINYVGGREFLTYRGKGLPLVRLEHYLPVAPMDITSKDAYLIIPKKGDGIAGILASQIVDTLDTTIELEKSMIQHPGVKGSAVVNNHLTLFLEPSGLIEAAGLMVLV